MNEKKELQRVQAERGIVTAAIYEQWNKADIDALFGFLTTKSVPVAVQKAYLMTAKMLDFNPFQKGLLWLAEFEGEGRGYSVALGADGWRTIVTRQPRYDGHKLEWLVYDPEKDEVKENASKLYLPSGAKIDQFLHDGGNVAARLTVYLKDISHPIVFEARLSDFYKPQRAGGRAGAWQKNPWEMLENRGWTHIAKRVDPSGSAGLIDKDDAIERGARLLSADEVEIKAIPSEDNIAPAPVNLATAATAPAKAESAHATTAEVAAKIKSYFGNSASSAAAIAKKLPPIEKADLASISQDELSALIEDANAPVLNPVAADELFGGGDDNK